MLSPVLDLSGEERPSFCMCWFHCPRVDVKVAEPTSPEKCLMLPLVEPLEDFCEEAGGGLARPS